MKYIPFDGFTPHRGIFMSKANRGLLITIIFSVPMVGLPLVFVIGALSDPDKAAHLLGFIFVPIEIGAIIFVIVLLMSDMAVYKYEGFIKKLSKSFEYNFYSGGGAIALDPTNSRLAVWDEDSNGGVFEVHEIRGYRKGEVTRTSQSTQVIPVGDGAVVSSSTSTKSRAYIDFMTSNVKTPRLRVWYPNGDEKKILDLLGRISIVFKLT